MGMIRKAVRVTALITTGPIGYMAIDSQKTANSKKSAKELKRMRQIMERNAR